MNSLPGALCQIQEKVEDESKELRGRQEAKYFGAENEKQTP